MLTSLTELLSALLVIGAFYRGWRGKYEAAFSFFIVAFALDGALWTLKIIRLAWSGYYV